MRISILIVNCFSKISFLRHLNEPHHDKTNKMSMHPAKIQISLGIHPAWTESLLSVWWHLASLHVATQWAHSKDSDQTGRKPRLIWVFAGRTVILLVLSWCGSNEKVHVKGYLAQACLCFCAVSPKPLSFAYTICGTRGSFRGRTISLIPPTVCTCAFEGSQIAQRQGPFLRKLAQMCFSFYSTTNIRCCRWVFTPRLLPTVHPGKAITSLSHNSIHRCRRHTRRERHQHRRIQLNPIKPSGLLIDGVWSGSTLFSKVPQKDARLIWEKTMGRHISVWKCILTVIIITQFIVFFSMLILVPISEIKCYFICKECITFMSLFSIQAR